jgi:hypothetical protein
MVKYEKRNLLFFHSFATSPVRRRRAEFCQISTPAGIISEK